MLKGFLKVEDVANEYITHLKRNGTSSDYSVESIYRNHIKSELGERRIKSIKLKDIKELQNRMLDKKYNGNKSYSNKSINMVTSVFNMIMNYAVKYEYISSNPCSNNKPLKLVKTHDKVKFWTDKEFRKAIVYEKDFVWYCYLVLSYLTGMRKGEIRGLHWKDVDFIEGRITINRHINDKLSSAQRSNREVERIIDGRKNGDSHIVLLDNSSLKLLKKLKEQEKTRVDFSEKDFVFGRKHPVGQNTPKRHLDAIAEKAKLTPITIHGLRHSHASYLISKGLNAYEVAERIGDKVEMVLSVYGHLFPNPQSKIVKTLNKYFNFEFDD